MPAAVSQIIPEPVSAVPPPAAPPNILAENSSLCKFLKGIICTSKPNRPSAYPPIPPYQAPKAWPVQFRCLVIGW